MTLTMFRTVRDSYRSQTFIGQLILNMCINFGVNFGLQWATFSKWGDRKNPAAWPGLTMWVLNTDVNSCLGMDITITAFLMAFACTLLATGGTQKEVREKKCAVLDPRATSGGYWPYTPVRYRGLCARSCAMGFYFWLLAGVPTIFILWMSVQDGAMNALAYTIFKGLWAFVVSGFVYALLFPAAIDKRNFPELEFEELMQLQATSWKDDPPPMVGNVGFI
jgi:hypothetical protein